MTSNDPQPLNGTESGDSLDSLEALMASHLAHEMDVSGTEDNSPLPEAFVAKEQPHDMDEIRSGDLCKFPAEVVPKTPRENVEASGTVDSPKCLYGIMPEERPYRTDSSGAECCSHSPEANEATHVPHKMHTSGTGGSLDALEPFMTTHRPHEIDAITRDVPTEEPREVVAIQTREPSNLLQGLLGGKERHEMIASGTGDFSKSIEEFLAIEQPCKMEATGSGDSSDSLETFMKKNPPHGGNYSKPVVKEEPHQLHARVLEESTKSIGGFLTKDEMMDPPCEMEGTGAGDSSDSLETFMKKNPLHGGNYSKPVVKKEPHQLHAGVREESTKSREEIEPANIGRESYFFEKPTRDVGHHQVSNILPSAWGGEYSEASDGMLALKNSSIDRVQSAETEHLKMVPLLEGNAPVTSEMEKAVSMKEPLIIDEMYGTNVAVLGNTLEQRHGTLPPQSMNDLYPLPSLDHFLGTTEDVNNFQAPFNVARTAEGLFAGETAFPMTSERSDPNTSVLFSEGLHPFNSHLDPVQAFWHTDATGQLFEGSQNQQIYLPGSLPERTDMDSSVAPDSIALLAPVSQEPVLPSDITSYPFVLQQESNHNVAGQKRKLPGSEMGNCNPFFEGLNETADPHQTDRKHRRIETKPLHHGAAIKSPRFCSNLTADDSAMRTLAHVASVSDRASMPLGGQVHPQEVNFLLPGESEILAQEQVGISHHQDGQHLSVGMVPLRQFGVANLQSLPNTSKYTDVVPDYEPLSVLPGFELSSHLPVVGASINEGDEGEQGKLEPFSRQINTLGSTCERKDAQARRRIGNLVAYNGTAPPSGKMRMGRDKGGEQHRRELLGGNNSMYINDPTNALQEMRGDWHQEGMEPLKEPGQGSPTEPVSLLFKKPFNLQKDRRHPTQKPPSHACPTCGDMFRSSENVGRHVRCHQGEIKYVCKKCQAGFNSPRTLTLHLSRVHKEERKTAILERLVCEFCSEVKIGKCSLKRHIRIKHMKEKPFQCNICENVYSTNHNLTIHLMKVHNFQIEEQ